MSCRSTSAGFTFVDLIITMLVMSLMVSCLLIEYAHARSNMEGATAVAELHKAMVYLEDYKTIHDAYPRTVGELRRGSPYRLHPEMRWRAYNARPVGASRTISVRMVITWGSTGPAWLADYPLNGTLVSQQPR